MTEQPFVGTRRQPRILLLMPELGARRGGGICQVGRSLMRLLAEKHRERALDCRVLSLGQADDEAECDTFRQEWEGRLKWFGDRRLAFSAAALAGMATWADAAIIMHVGLASLLPLLPRPLRPASFTFIHGIEVWRPLQLRHRLALRASDCVVAISQFTAERASHFNPWLGPVHCCHLGAPCSPDNEPRTTNQEHVRAPRPAPRFLTPDTLNLTPIPGPHDILIVGRMAQGEGQKGHRELIDAMGPVIAALPDARLLVAGTGDDAQAYIDQARRSPVSQSIVFLGYVPDEVLRRLYRRVGVLAMPSRQEGFGLVYLEAMAAGLPCLASTCDAASEVVVDGETGLLVDPADQPAIVNALTRILRDPDLRKKLGCQGRKRFEENFTEERFHQRMWNIIEQSCQIRNPKSEIQRPKPQDLSPKT